MAASTIYRSGVCFGHVFLFFCVFSHLIRSIVADISNSSSMSGTHMSFREKSENDFPSLSNNDKDMMTLPLIPHHVQKRRRRRAAEEAGEDFVFAIDADGSERRRRAASGEGEHHHHHHSDKSTGAKEKDTIEAQYQNGTDAGTELGVSALQIGALYQGYGTHYIDLWCGTPAQRQTVIVDTGSSVTAFPCSGCHNCGESVYHTDALFDETSSTSFQKVKCNECYRGRCSLPKGSKYNDCKIGMSYQEGSSWTAFEAKDFCYVAGPHNMQLDLPERPDIAGLTPGDDLDPAKASEHAFELVFGCQTKLTGLFKTQLADGIMGMDNAREAFWQQMHSAGKMPQRIFTLCYSRSPHVDREGTEAGALTLGGFDQRLHKSPLLYSQDSASSGFYAVKIRKIYMREGGGGDSIQSTNPNLKIQQIGISEADLAIGRTIVDSGTTDTYFTRKMALPFKGTWKQIAGFDYSQIPVALTAEKLDAYPTIILQLQGHSFNSDFAGNADPDSITGLAGSLDPENPYDILVAVSPRHYMEYDEDTKKYVNRLYLDESRGTVLGANVMMGHDVVFDVKNNKVGWAESDCDYTNLVKKNGYDETLIGGVGETHVIPHEHKPKKENQPDEWGEGGLNYETEEESEDDSQASEDEEDYDVVGAGKSVKSPSDGILAANKGFTLPTELAPSDNQSICSSSLCQGGVFAVLIVFAVVVMIRFIPGRTIQFSGGKTKTQEQPSSQQLSELELQEGYRDNPIHRDDDFDDDEMPKRRDIL